MDEICFAFPLLPGTRERARRFLREVERERRDDHLLASRRVGIDRESWYLQPAPAGDQLLVHFASWNLAEALERLRRSREPFHTWFAAHLATVTGVSLTDWLAGPRSEPLSVLDNSGRGL